MRREATLLHRGEHFRYVEDEEIWEGECVWAWESPGPDGGLPRRVYPITLDVGSIRRTGAARPRRIDRDRQRAVAEEVKRILEEREPGCEIRLLERPRPALRRAPSRDPR